MLKFLIGQNDYGKLKYLKEAIDYSDQLNTITLDVPTIDEIINECINPPIMADTKVVVVWSDKKLDWEVFKEFFPKIPIDTSLFMCVDALPKDTSIFKPMCTQFNNLQTDKELKSYLKDRLKTINFKFASSEASEVFFALAGQSELDIDNWLNYLFELFPDQKINVKQVRANVPKIREITPYNIIDYMVQGQVEYTLYLLENYIANGGDLMALNNILIWKTRQWLMTYWAVEHQKIKRRELASILDVKSFIVNKLVREIEKFGDTLPAYFLELVQVSQDIKYGSSSFGLKDVVWRMSVQCRRFIPVKG